MKGWRLGLFANMMILALLACDRDRQVCKANETETAVDPALLAFLSRARSAHHIADSQEHQHPDQALIALRTVLHGPRPGLSGNLGPEVREVLADTAARVGDLESQLNNFDSAKKTLLDALSWVPEPSYFRGHLFEVLGLLEERRARQLEQSGKQDTANQARVLAIDAFEESMKIQAEVVRTTQADAGK